MERTRQPLDAKPGRPAKKLRLSKMWKWTIGIAWTIQEGTLEQTSGRMSACVRAYRLSGLVRSEVPIRNCFGSNATKPSLPIPSPINGYFSSDRHQSFKETMLGKFEPKAKETFDLILKTVP
jgi:hypothetical protein